MKAEIVMPKMGESVTEGTIIKWHKEPGDKIEKDEILFEISTDKVDTEVPSSEEGVLSERKAEEGDTVEVGDVVAIIDTEGEASGDTGGDEAEKEEKKAKKEKAESKEESGKEEKDKEDVDEDVELEVETHGDLSDIIMPKMGESITEGTILKWHKQVGDKIDKDDILFEISTDKVDTEVPSPEDGVLAEILFEEQEVVEVGQVVAKISKSGDVKKTSGKKKTEPEDETKAEAKTEKKTTEKSDIDEETTVSDMKAETGKFFSPLVLNIARKEGVSMSELESIEGTGQNGRVTKKDILEYIEGKDKTKTKAPKKETEKKSADTALSQKPSFETEFAKGQVEEIPMDNVRQKIMEHMVHSRDTSVHVTGMIEVDMSRIHDFIKRKKETYLKNEGVKLTYLSFIAHASIKALRKHPLVNASIEGKTILKKKFVNLGIAVALEPNGLIVPNVKNAHEKNITGLSREINDLAQRARTRKVTPDEISGGTFTITNYGVFGTLFGTPIINQPEVAILGVGTVTKRPVVVTVDGTDTIAIKPMMYLTLSHDHRLVDGMLGGLFLKSIKEILESFDEENMVY